MRIFKKAQILKAAVMLAAVSAVVQAQHPVVPPLVNFNGILTDLNGEPLTGITGVSFHLYQNQEGGTPLWMETQNIQPDQSGRYRVLLGSTTNTGLPSNLFAAGEARWLGVQIEGQPEQPRVLLASVPYALKAVDAQTVGGLPASAFLLANVSSGHVESANATSASSSAAGPSLAGTGTADFIPLWIDSTGDLGNSVVYQSGSGSTAMVGINTTSPASTLDVEGGATIRGQLSLPNAGKATAAAGKNSQPLTLAASVFNGSTSTAVNQTFQWQAEPAGNDTSNFSGSLNLLFADGKSTPAETGLHIASNGQIGFAAGQAFPGAGTITSVSAGTDLTGGGAAGNVTLSLDTTKIPQLGAHNTFTANQTVNGSVTATSFAGSGAGVTNVNASQLGGFASDTYARLGASNTFTGQQTLTGTNASGVLVVTNTAATGQAPAIVGTTNSSAAFAVKGIVTASTGNLAGVFGSTSSTAGSGMNGQGPNLGVYGSGNGSSTLGTMVGSLAGVWGDTGAPAGTQFVGVLGTSDGNQAAYFTNNSQVSSTLVAVNTYTANSASPVFQTIGTGFGNKGCLIDVSGNLTCNGTVSGVVQAGAQKVSVYATQATENWFEDAGSGQLSGGFVRITLDPTFAQTVNASVKYHVFLTPNGDCEGLYVSDQTAQGFEVHELRGGHSNIAFDYRIMAKRTGFETVRMADVTQKYEALEKQQRTLREQIAQGRAQQSRAIPGGK